MGKVGCVQSPRRRFSEQLDSDRHAVFPLGRLTNLLDVMDRLTLTIDGRPYGGETTFPVMNPATLTIVGNTPDCSQRELDAAVNAARNTLSGWSNTTSEEHRTVLECFAAAIQTISVNRQWAGRYIRRFDDAGVAARLLAVVPTAPPLIVPAAHALNVVRTIRVYIGLRDTYAEMPDSRASSF